eukprot:scaffold9550_cov35-Tisochrysis_lutea.AAC.2
MHHLSPMNKSKETRQQPRLILRFIRSGLCEPTPWRQADSGRRPRARNRRAPSRRQRRRRVRARGNRQSGAWPAGSRRRSTSLTSRLRRCGTSSRGTPTSRKHSGGGAGNQQGVHVYGGPHGPHLHVDACAPS